MSPASYNLSPEKLVTKYKYSPLDFYRITSLMILFTLIHSFLSFFFFLFALEFRKWNGLKVWDFVLEI